MKIAVAGATGRLGRPLVELLAAGGHDVVAMSRSRGVNVISGAGLAEALAGVECVINAATVATPEQEAATRFFITSSRNLQQAGARAGVQRMVLVSIIGIDRFTAGYYVAKVAQERAMLEGPVPVRILRATQFHEFVAQLVDWGRRGDVSYLPKMRTQLLRPAALLRRSRTWRPTSAARVRRRPPAAAPSGRLPAPGPRTWLTRRGCSSPGAATG